MSSPREIHAILAALVEGPAALATLVSVAGSSYRQPGARCLLLPDGTTVGSISGGCLEEDVRDRARRVLADGRPQIAVYDTASENDLVWGTGLGCQGRVRVLFERLPAPLPEWVGALRENFRLRKDTRLRVVHGAADHRELGTSLLETQPHTPGSPDEIAYVERIAAPPALAVFGAGDDAIPLVRFARELGWHVMVFDARSSYATPARFPAASSVLAAAPHAAGADAAIDERTHVIVMTHRYRDDLTALRVLLGRPLAYLGVLGPRRRTDRMFAELASEGVKPSEEMNSRIFAPVGLDLGGAAPETVALSIIAELQAFHSKRVPSHLRDGNRPIHG
jgi:xanthine dehydrogenase accessory factor